MKTLLTVLLLAIAAQGRAQTYCQITVTNFNFDGRYYSQTTSNLDVPAGTLFTVINTYESDGNFNGYGGVSAEYPQTTNQIYIQIGSLNGYSGGEPKVLGPCTIHFTCDGNSSRGDIAVLIGKLETVNITPALTGYGVQPNGKTATVQLQTSTDLTTWTTATNGTYAATNSAAFYRMKLEIQ